MVTAQSGIAIRDIVATAIGGHSLGTVPLDDQGNLLLEWTPLWSDGRAHRQAEIFFDELDEKNWYMKTGAGLPPGNYPLFKIKWYQDNQPELAKKISKIVGTKDYLNYLLTGKIATDPSNAASFGLWNINTRSYDEEIAQAAKIPISFFPEVQPSTSVLGNLLPNVATELGLLPETKVITGAIDNCCIALGSRCYLDGRLTASLGSCSWIARSSDHILLDYEARPFIYPHVMENEYLHSVAVFSTGTALQWVRNNLCRNINDLAMETGRNPYFLMVTEAAKSNIGANRLIFNPSLGGPSIGDEHQGIRGGFLGLSLEHTQADIIRATIEGIAMNLRVAFDRLKKLGPIEGPINLVGDPLNELVRNIYIHALGTSVVTNQIPQGIPALGVAAIAAVGSGVWSDFSPLESLNREMELVGEPDPYCMERYDHVYQVFKKSFDYLNQLADDWSGGLALEQ